MVVQARTRLARTAVIAAAKDLFVERGYAPTTVEAISERADVPSATVYRLFSSKLGILKAVLDVSIAGDDEEVPVADRPAVQSLLADPDPRAKLAAFVDVAAQVNARTSAVYRILTSAAAADADTAGLLDQLTAQRRRGQGRVARALAESNALRAGVRERDARDIIHALVSPEVYGLLVIDRAWSADRYRAWLTETLIAQLVTDR